VDEVSPPLTPGRVAEKDRLPFLHRHEVSALLLTKITRLEEAARVLRSTGDVWRKPSSGGRSEEDPYDGGYHYRR
jgi:hypothetical protein